MASNLPGRPPAPGEEPNVQLGPEFFRPSTGGLPPLIQLEEKARRKSDPPSPPADPSIAPREVPSLQFGPFEHRFFETHDDLEGVSVWRGKVRKEGWLSQNLSLQYKAFIHFTPSPLCESPTDMIRHTTSSTMELSGLCYSGADRP